MKIAVVANNNLIYLPYLDKYLRLLQQFSVDYEVITWDRMLIECPEDVESYTFFKYHAPITNTKVQKVRDYFQYYKFVKNVLNKKNYDRLIILTTQTGVMLNRLLAIKYKNKYLFDVRDHTYENLPIYRQIFENLVRNSALTVISSPAYRRWLPEAHEYVLTHNIDREYLQDDQNTNDYPSFNGKKVVISFIGMIRYYEENICLINSLANSDRFELRYIGQGQCEQELFDYCCKKGIKNVSFHGRYGPSEKASFYNQADMVNCLFGTQDTASLTLIPNRLYECCVFQKPIIVSKGSYMAEVVEKNELGLVLNLRKDNVVTKVLDYINCFDPNRYRENCTKFLIQVRAEEEVFYSAVKSFCQ